MNKVVLLFALFALLILSAGCMPPPVLPPATDTPRVVATADAVPASPQAPSVAPSSSSAIPTPSPRPTARPTPTSSPIVDIVEDCMAGCHPPEPTEWYAAGAMAKPADHKGRTTCLECHGQPMTKPLPETHVGRLDPSCNTCHQ